MRIARHWVRGSAYSTDKAGQTVRGESWGWSESTVEEARGRAQEAAQRVAEWLANGGQDAMAPKRSFQYSYCDERPPREELVQELDGSNGEPSAVITRNSYGSLVLNARDLMFIDVDFERPKPSGGGLLGRLFGKKALPPDGPNTESGALARLRSWCGRNRERGVRIYRTAAGFRAAIVDRPMDAGGAEAAAIMADLGSDPLYRRLCEVQQCFRARLTPKPWRMEMHAPPHRFPFEDAVREQEFRAWQQQYDAAAPAFATCRLLETHGPPAGAAELASLVELHDSLTGCGREAPLA